MSSTPTLSALNADTETYPLLTLAQIARVRPCAPSCGALRGEMSCISQAILPYHFMSSFRHQ
jgi:hypothetical protein